MNTIDITRITLELVFLPPMLACLVLLYKMRFMCVIQVRSLKVIYYQAGVIICYMIANLAVTLAHRNDTSNVCGVQSIVRLMFISSYSYAVVVKGFYYLYRLSITRRLSQSIKEPKQVYVVVSTPVFFAGWFIYLIICWLPTLLTNLNTLDVYNRNSRSCEFSPTGPYSIIPAVVIFGLVLNYVTFVLIKVYDEVSYRMEFLVGGGIAAMYCVIAAILYVKLNEPVRSNAIDLMLAILVITKFGFHITSLVWLGFKAQRRFDHAKGDSNLGFSGNEMVKRSISELLTSPEEREALLNFAKLQFCMEIIVFVEEVGHWKTKFDTNNENTVNTAKDISNKFVRTGSTYELNLPSNTRDQVLSDLQKAELQKTLFDEAQWEVELLLLSNYRYSPKGSAKL